MIPGEYLLDPDANPIEANANRKVQRVLVRNTGDRPVQVGSHYHFFETNAWLAFDRAKAYGKRLNIASGTAVRFEPGEEKEVELTDFAGARVIHGFLGLVEGALDHPATRAEAIERARKAGLLAHEEGKTK
ncbi:MAG TPA: urease subunit beta [Terriglobales bacterium]|nr:urease subunit beta [Terriglobales bacterium]